MKFMNVTKALLVSGIVFAGLQHNAHAMKRAGLKPATTSPFADSSKTVQKVLYETLMKLDAEKADEAAIVSAVDAAMNDTEVFARSEAQSKILEVTTVSFAKHLGVVQAKLGDELLGKADDAIGLAEKAYATWIPIFSADGGDSVKEGCDAVAEKLSELFDCIQHLINAAESKKKAVAIVEVKRTVDDLQKQLTDGKAAHTARASRLALMPAQLEVAGMNLKAKQQALTVALKGQSYVKNAGANAKSGASDVGVDVTAL